MCILFQSSHHCISVGKEMWRSGRCERWFRDCDSQIREVSSTVNGVMLTDLASAAGFQDMQCIEFFRTGKFC